MKSEIELLRDKVARLERVVTELVNLCEVLRPEECPELEDSWEFMMELIDEHHPSLN